MRGSRVPTQGERAARGLPLVVHHLTYSGAMEATAISAASTREAALFSEFIRAQQHLVLPVDMEAGSQASGVHFASMH